MEVYILSKLLFWSHNHMHDIVLFCDALTPITQTHFFKFFCFTLLEFFTFLAKYFATNLNKLKTFYTDYTVYTSLHILW